MTNQELDQKLKSLAATERSLTKEVIEHIAEVDKRKLHLDYAYSSLFAYLTLHIGYSEGAAQRRIDAARLLIKVPEVAKAIENGTIHLSQVSKVQRICRQIKKESGQTIQALQQKSIIQKLENKNSTQTDLILAQEFNIKIETKDLKRIQKDESVRVELTFSKEEMQLIETARTLLSNKTGGGLKSTLLELAKKLIKDSSPKNTAIKDRTEAQSKAPDSASSKANYISDIAADHKTKFSTATVAAKPMTHAPVSLKNVPSHLKSVTPKLRKEILKRDQVCQFKDPKTGRLCGSKYFLEVDHIQPRYLNGPHTQENLRILCKNHNLFRYEKRLL